MSCYHPLTAWRVTDGGRFHFDKPPEFDKKTAMKIYFSLPEEKRMAYHGNCDTFVSCMEFNFKSALQVVQLPCGQCIGCRIDRSKQWAVRCYCEAKLHACNYFVTLTYAPAHLPQGNTLVPEDLQLFNKRVRYYYGKGVRFYAAGEYGSKRGRPHYHICFFNLALDDLKFYKSRGDITLYISPKLTEIWGKGYVVIGDLNLESAAYVARYISKKWLGGTEDELAMIYGGRHPEFSRMSLKPGIGAGFYERFKQDIYPKDFLTIKGVKYPAPRYFDRLLSREFAVSHNKIAKNKNRDDELATWTDEEMNLDWISFQDSVDMLSRRIARAEVHAEDNTPDRLAARELCFRKRIERLVRVLEDEEKSYEEIME